MGPLLSDLRKDLRAPIRDFVNQFVFVLLAAILQVAGGLLHLARLKPWLITWIEHAFDALLIVALGKLVIGMTSSMLVGAYTDLGKSIERLRK